MVGSIATGVLGQLVLVTSGVVVARALGPENRGLLALVFVLSAIATQIGSIGVPLSVTYWIAAERVGPRSLLRGLRGFRSLQLVLILVVQGGLILIVLEPKSPPGFLWVAFLSLAATVSSLSQMYGLAVLQGLRRFGAFNSLRILNGALYAAGAVGLWMIGKATLTSITLVVIAASVAAAGATSLVVLRGTPATDRNSEIPTRRIVSFGLRSLLGSSPPVETFRLDQLLVGLALPPIVLGYYIVALAFTNLTRFIGQSIGIVTYPEVAAADNRSSQLRIIRRHFVLGAAISGSLTVILVVLVPWLLPFFFGSDFEPAGTAARILLVGTFFASIRRILGDGTRGSGWPLWSATAELLTLLALPAVVVVTRYTDSLASVALVLAGANLVSLFAIAPALFGVQWRPESLYGLRALHEDRRLLPTRLFNWAAAVILPAAISVLVAAAIVHYGAFARWASLGAVALITSLQLLTWRARLGRVPFAAIILVALNSVAILGELFYRRVADMAAVSATLSTDPAVYRSAAIIFSAASLALWLGGLVGTIGVKRGAATDVPDHRLLIEFIGRWKVFPTLIVSSIPLALGVAGLSVHGMLHRPSYSQTYGPVVLVKIAYILLPIGLAGAALLLFNGQQRRARMLGLLLLLLYAIYLFSKGSRAITLLPIILSGTYLLLPTREGRRRSMGPLSRIVVAGGTFVLLHLPLALRGGNAGLSPYVARIFANPNILWPSNPVKDIGNVLFSVPLTGDVATNSRRLPLSDFLTSVNPLPGSLTNWSAIQGGLRINANTPFNTFGELALHGMPVLIGYFVVVGFIAIRLQIGADKLGGVRSLVGRLAVGASLALFSISILQYNLRSSTRLLWYAGIIVALLQFIPRLTPSLPPFSSTSRNLVRRG